MNNDKKENPILCIPRIDESIKKTYIFEKIKKLNRGVIQKINEIPLKNELTKKRIIIYLKWNENESSKKYKSIIERDESIKLVYEENNPFFWKILKFKQ